MRPRKCLLAQVNPIHMAASSKNPKALQLLLDLSAVVDQQDVRAAGSALPPEHADPHGAVAALCMYGRAW